MVSKDQRAQITGQVYFILMFQLLVAGGIMSYIYNDEEFLREVQTMPTSTMLVFCRFACAVMLHLTLASELENGLSIMKYALNHQERFVSSGLGVYFVNLGRVVMIVLVEIVNMFLILASNTAVEVVLNTLGLAFIANFDDLYYESLKSNPIKDKIVETDDAPDLFRI